MFTHIPSKAVAVIAQHMLGDNPTATLVAHGIKGAMNSPDSCPLAKWFRRFFPTDVSVATCTAHFERFTFHVVLNRQCQDLVLDFDGGQRPELDEDYSFSC
jgi:hypothetical protein